MPIDTLNQEKRDAKTGIGSKISKNLSQLPGIRQLRNLIGGKANAKANAEIYEMKQKPSDLPIPTLVGEFGKHKDNRDTFRNPENQL